MFSPRVSSPFTFRPGSTSNAEYCFGSLACQYLADNAFASSSSTAWSYGSNSGWAYKTDPCGSGSTGVAELAPGDSVWQLHATDTGFLHWKVQLDLYKTSTTVGAYDRFTVFVSKDNGTTETFVISAADYTGLCAGGIVLPLANDYNGNGHAKVSIRRHSLSTVPMYIDNVSFFGTTY